MNQELLKSLTQQYLNGLICDVELVHQLQVNEHVRVQIDQLMSMPPAVREGLKIEQLVGHIGQQTADNYANWRWRMELKSDLCGTTLLRASNVQFVPGEGPNNHDAVFVHDIATEREFQHLLNWAAGYFGSLEVGGGRKPDGKWWVRISARSLQLRNLPYPHTSVQKRAKKEKNDEQKNAEFFKRLTELVYGTEHDAATPGLLPSLVSLTHGTDYKLSFHVKGTGRDLAMRINKNVARSKKAPRLSDDSEDGVDHYVITVDDDELEALGLFVPPCAVEV